METTKSLLDEVKVRKDVQTDYALAKELSLHRGLISDYYSGKRTPNEFACLQIAEALGRCYEEIQAIVRIEAEKDETRREAWKRYYKSIVSLAAMPSMAEMATAPVGEPSRSWWPGAESNCRHADFQSAALPTELPSR